MSWALQWLPSRLATHCGSGRLYDSQWVREDWFDPPRSPTVIEWLDLMLVWHRLLHSGSSEARSKNWPQPPPTIWKFCATFDLPVPEWAIENAQRHGWTDMLDLARKQAGRHAYLCSLTPESRLSLYKMERRMSRLARDHEWALKGYVRTGDATWHWPRRLLMDPVNSLEQDRLG
jgi:hypothetical protein